MSGDEKKDGFSLGVAIGYLNEFTKSATAAKDKRIADLLAHNNDTETTMRALKTRVAYLIEHNETLLTALTAERRKRKSPSTKARRRVAK